MNCSGSFAYLFDVGAFEALNHRHALEPLLAGAKQDGVLVADDAGEGDVDISDLLVIDGEAALRGQAACLSPALGEPGEDIG